MRAALAILAAIACNAHAATGISWGLVGMTPEQEADARRVIALFESVIIAKQAYTNGVSPSYQIEVEYLGPGVLGSTSLLGAFTPTGSVASYVGWTSITTGLSREAFRQVMIHECGHYFGWTSEYWTYPGWWDSESFTYSGPAAATFADIYPGHTFWCDWSGHLGFTYDYDGRYTGEAMTVDNRDIMGADYDADETVSPLFWAVIEDSGWGIDWAQAEIKTGIAHAICPRRQRGPVEITTAPGEIVSH